MDVYSFLQDKGAITRLCRFMLIIGSGLFFESCSLLWNSVNTKYLGDWNVEPRQRITAKLTNGLLKEKQITNQVRALLLIEGDSVYLEPYIKTLPPDDGNPLTLDISDSALTLLAHNYLISPAKLQFEDSFRAWDSRFDVDAITVPFRYRFRQGRTIPGGFVSNPNVGIYAGWRTDMVTHQIQYTRNLCLSELSTVAFGFGAFSSINPVYVSPWNTDYGVDVEYDGLGVNYGVAAIAGYRQMTVGLLLGFELLLDENHIHWVFHNKPWIGVSLGLNLN